MLGLLNDIGTPHLAFTLTLNVLMLGAIYVLDHPRVLTAAERRHVTFDAVYIDPEQLRSALSERMGATVTECTVSAIDDVRDTTELEVQYLERSRPPRRVPACTPATAMAEASLAPPEPPRPSTVMTDAFVPDIDGWAGFR